MLCSVTSALPGAAGEQVPILCLSTPSYVLHMQYKLKHGKDTAVPSTPKKTAKFLQDPIDFSAAWYELAFLCQCEGPLQNGELMQHMLSVMQGPTVAT